MAMLGAAWAHGPTRQKVRESIEINAPPAKVFEVVTDYEHQVGNMPYIEKMRVFSRTDSGWRDISTMPPALSVIGPNTSIARM